ncbi:hypothetical protein D3C71_1454620 [compost metagenome]
MRLQLHANHADETGAHTDGHQKQIPEPRKALEQRLLLAPPIGLMFLQLSEQVVLLFGKPAGLTAYGRRLPGGAGEPEQRLVELRQLDGIVRDDLSDIHKIMLA